MILVLGLSAFVTNTRNNSHLHRLSSPHAHIFAAKTEQQACSTTVAVKLNGGRPAVQPPSQDKVGDQDTVGKRSAGQIMETRSASVPDNMFGSGKCRVHLRRQEIRQRRTSGSHVPQPLQMPLLPTLLDKSPSWAVLGSLPLLSLGSYGVV